MEKNWISPDAETKLATSYISQEERDFRRVERISIVVALAIIGAFVVFNWDYYFSSGSEALFTQHTEVPEETAVATVAIGKKKKERGGIAYTAAPADPSALVPEDVEAYIEKWAPTAIGEMRRSGVPASITLAQGILESHAGKSGLALSANNHFGIKCHVKGKCKAGHCINFTDDVDLDYFLVFQNPYKSFRAHSEFLKRPRYKACFECEEGDYSCWATELKKAGYATDKRYAEKIIAIVEKYKLNEYDGE